MANFGPYRWHANSNYTYKEVSGYVNAWYSGTTVFADTSVTQKTTYIAYGGGYGPDTIHLFIAGHEVGSASIGAYRGTYTVGTSGNWNTGAGDFTVEVKIQCGDYKSCPIGAYTNWVTIGSVGIHVPNPYTPSSIWLNPDNYTKIGRVDVSSWSFNYSYNAGSNPSVPITLAIHDYNATSWGVKWEPKLRDVSGSSSGVWDSVVLRTAQGFANASRYRVTLVSKGGEALSPNSWNPQEGYPIYTYQEPTIGTNIAINLSKQNANTANTFTITNINNRAWASYENEFQTRYRLKRGTNDYTNWTNCGNVSVWNRTAAQIREMVPKQYDTQNILIEMKRYSPSADWWSTNTATGNFKVIYRPRITINENNVTYRRNSNSGSGVSKGQVVINDSSLSGINVAWGFNFQDPEAGYTQGYRIRLYNAQNQLVKTYYTTNQDYTIPKNDIPKMQNTKIDITPYFMNDSTNPKDYWYYNKEAIQKINFIILSSSLNKPTITYPVNNSNWLNDKYRVCFTLPIDADKGAEYEDYRYENIELQINGSLTIKIANSIDNTNGSILAPECFNALPNNLTYLRNIVINPSLCSNYITNLSRYTLRIRVKKKYGYSNSEPLWSQWSDNVIVKVTKANFNPNPGDLILATHYNNSKELIKRVIGTYNISWIEPPKNVSSKIDIIHRNQFPYKNLFEKISQVKNLVNTFGTFDEDQDNVKFDASNSLLNSFEPTIEHITALTNENESPNGRNYIKLIYDRCNLLK